MSTNLRTIFQNTANSIRTVLGTQDKIAPDNFDNRILGLKTNIYKTATIAEMNEISGETGDLCVVTTFSEQNLTESFTEGTITLPDSVTLPTAVTGMKMLDDMGTCRLNAQLMNDGMYFNCRIDRERVMAEYSSNDGQHYTKVSGPEEVAVSGVQFMGFDDTFGYFFKVMAASFDGIFTYDGTSWVNYNIGANTASADVLLGKKAYTNNGLVVGTRDMRKYKDWRFYLQNTEPTEKSGIWCTYDSSYTNPIDAYASYPDLFAFGFTEDDVNEAAMPTFVRNKGFSSSISETILTQNGILHSSVHSFSYNNRNYSSLKQLIIGTKLYMLRSQYNNQYMFVIDLTNDSVTQKSMPSITYSHDTSIYSSCITSDGSTIVMVLCEITNSSTNAKTFRAYKYSIANNTWTNQTLATTTGDAYMTCRGVINAGDNKYIACISQNSSPSNIKLVTFYGTNTTTSTITLTINSDTFPQKCMDKVVSLFQSGGYYKVTNGILDTGVFTLNVNSLTESSIKNAIINSPKTIVGAGGIVLGDYACNFRPSVYGFSSTRIDRGYSAYNCTFPNLVLPSGVIGSGLAYTIGDKLYLHCSDSKIYSYNISDIKHRDGVINFQIGPEGTFCDNMIADFNCSIINVGATSDVKTSPNIIQQVYYGNGTSWELIKDNTQ